MYKKYYMKINDNNKIDSKIYEFLIFREDVLSYVKDILLLQNKYKRLLNSKNN